MGAGQQSQQRRAAHASLCKSCARDRYRAALAALAPGTPLREGIQRVQRRRCGALIVMGYDDTVAAICSGGFLLDAELSATRLAELAKMDGAIVIDSTRIVQAAVHLIPDRDLSTDESGTRHRTADRVAQHTGHPVVSVSQSAGSVTLYIDNRSYALEDPFTLRTRANQSLATVERCARRFDELTAALAALDGMAAPLDVAAAAQRLEMAHRASEEVEECAVALGSEGALLLLQRDELVRDLDDQMRIVLRNHCPLPQQAALHRLRELSNGKLGSVTEVARALGFDGQPTLPAPRGTSRLLDDLYG